MSDTRYFFTKCPTCGTETANHQLADGSIICQECEVTRALSPSEMIRGGQRRFQPVPVTIQNKIAKATGEQQPPQDQALANFLANRGRTS